MIIIDGPRAIELMHDAVTLAGRDHEVRTCVYVDVATNLPSCIVGTALAGAGVDVVELFTESGPEDYPEYRAGRRVPAVVSNGFVNINGTGIGAPSVIKHLAANGVEISSGALVAFQYAQSVQDGAQPVHRSWGRAIEYAQERMAEQAEASAYRADFGDAFPELHTG